LTNALGIQPLTASESVVYVIDDDESQRKALSSLFRSSGMGVETFSSCDDFLRFKRPEIPGCLILDVRLQGYSGLVFQEQEALRREPIPIVFITSHGDVWMCAKAMKAGAIDFLTKPHRDQEVLDAAVRGIERDFIRRRLAIQNAELERRFETLSHREREVMSYIFGGLANKQIAATLGLSEVTVKIHRGHLMQKMGSRSVVDLVQKAGLLGFSQLRAI